MPQPSLKIKFDPNQDYQLEAVASISDLFDGLESQAPQFGLSGTEIVPNLPSYVHLPESSLYDNVLIAQEHYNAKPQHQSWQTELECDDGMLLEGVSNDSWRYPNFTVEMETGTGKTYVYLRTIYELNKRYGFTKFVVVVPSVAIYEGVVKNYNITRNHFSSIYGYEHFGLIQYDGSKLSQLRDFATSTMPNILVMTIQSFNSKSNNLYKPSEKLPGELLPYEYIQKTRPILILDEPQNMESETAKSALRTLNPLFGLRYSATHRSVPNPVYRLTPFEAFKRNLVKRIEVEGVTEQESANNPFLSLVSISDTGTITAKVRTFIQVKGIAREEEVTLRQDEDLFDKTHREEHKGGYKVREIRRSDSNQQGYIEFENNLRVTLNETIGASRPTIFREQIRRTIERHMEKQQQLAIKGIKVLSLFFIDRVANYTAPNGLVRQIFDEEFDKLKVHYPFFKDLKPTEVRQAYFATKQNKKTNQEEAIDTNDNEDKKKADEREAEKAAYKLIMRDKERLLSFGEKAAFIFAHSALKEGWDNPNVFQICTLRQSNSEPQKRQEIGRGLRLCVNQDGDRVFDTGVNILTVIANDSYKNFVQGLQNEYREAGQAAPPPPTDARRSPARRNDTIFNLNDFRSFWDKLCQKVNYRIQLDTDELVKTCVERINNQSTPKPVLMVEKADYVVTSYRLKLKEVLSGGSKAKVQLHIKDTTGFEHDAIHDFKKGDDLAKLQRREALRGFKVVEIKSAGDNSYLIFGNNIKLDMYGEYKFESEAGQKVQAKIADNPDQTYPVFNLLDRAARATGLTRPTINRIFRELSDKRKGDILVNPEGFAANFIIEVKNALADHIGNRLIFDLDASGADVGYQLDELFPPQRTFAQRELIDAGPNSLYDQVQIDSDVEKRFVENRLKPDQKIVIYFKFPPGFKIQFPKIIGNYNPDWAIIRWDEDGKLKLELVRETKGSDNIADLQFESEKRKIRVAQRYFEKLGLDYRFVTDSTPAWWQPEQATQPTLNLP